VPNQEARRLDAGRARGILDVAELLVRHGANAMHEKNGVAQTALMWAADARSAEMTRFLIGHKADVNAGRWPTTGRAR